MYTLRQYINPPSRHTRRGRERSRHSAEELLSRLFTGMSRTQATDLDVLVSRGFPVDQARRALKTSHGNLRQAVEMLRREMTSSARAADSSWLKESPDDWTDFIQTQHLPTDTTSRVRPVLCPLYTINCWIGLVEESRLYPRVCL